MSSCSTRRNVYLENQKTCLHVQEEDTPPCPTRTHFFLLNKRTCLLVQQVVVSTCRARRHVFLPRKKPRLLVEQEDVSSCSASARRRFLLLGKKTWHVFLLSKQTCLLVEQGNMSSCATRRHVELINRKTLRILTNFYTKLCDCSLIMYDLNEVQRNLNEFWRTCTKLNEFLTNYDELLTNFVSCWRALTIFRDSSGDDRSLHKHSPKVGNVSQVLQHLRRWWMEGQGHIVRWSPPQQWDHLLTSSGWGQPSPFPGKACCRPKE